LEVEWADRTFCNPPYSRKEKEEFIRKALKESLKGKLAVMLIPASTSTKIFHDLIKVYAKVEFIRGRLNFEGIDGDGNWCNPGEGMIPLPNVPEGCPQVRRAGQNDLMLVIFGEP
jgi:hypothetical protein